MLNDGTNRNGSLARHDPRIMLISWKVVVLLLVL